MIVEDSPGQEPVYDNGLAQLYLGDALDVMREVPDETIYLTFTSPPYYNARAYSAGNYPLTSRRFVACLSAQ